MPRVPLGVDGNTLMAASHRDSTVTDAAPTVEDLEPHAGGGSADRSGPTEAGPDPVGVRLRLVGWLDGRRLSSEERKACLEALSIRSSGPWWRRFFVVMAVSVVIATFGLLLGSTAVVIGAMLIAPLMTPVLALSASLAMGWPRQASIQSAGLVAATLGAVGLAWLIGTVVPNEQLTEEVLTRTSPDLRDLGVALAAGFGGAYVTVRRNMASSLPGVAVAVALVPPLGAVGLAFAAGQQELAFGAALLYGANLAAIVLSGLVVFLSTGFVPARRLSLSWVRVTFGAVVTIATVGAIAVPLAQQSARAVASAQTTEQVNRRISSWLSSSPNRLSMVEVDAKTVTVAIAGSVEPPPVQPLRQALEEIIGADLNLQIRWTQESSPQADEDTDAEPAIRSVEPPIPAARDLDPVVAEWLAQSEAPLESFEVTRIEVNDDRSVVVGLQSGTTPPPSRALSSLLTDEFGLSFQITVEWSHSAGQEPDPATDVAAQVRAVARRWVQTQPGTLTVDNVEVTNGIAYVDLIGQTAPVEAATLAEALARELDQPLRLEVRFTDRQIIPTNTTTPATTVTTTAVPSTSLALTSTSAEG